MQIGNEFASVEALWSQFENVMGKESDDGAKEGNEDETLQGQDDERREGQKPRS